MLSTYVLHKTAVPPVFVSVELPTIVPHHYQSIFLSAVPGMPIGLPRHFSFHLGEYFWEGESLVSSYLTHLRITYTTFELLSMIHHVSSRNRSSEARDCP